MTILRNFSNTQKNFTGKAIANFPNLPYTHKAAMVFNLNAKTEFKKFFRPLIFINAIQTEPPDLVNSRH